MGTDIKVNDKIVFYDGFCVMCSRFIRFIVFLDKRKTFKFSAISSDFASKVLSKKLDEFITNNKDSINNFKICIFKFLF